MRWSPCPSHIKTVWQPVKHLGPPSHRQDWHKHTKRANQQRSLLCVHLYICTTASRSCISDPRDDARSHKQTLRDGTRNETRWVKTIHKRTYSPWNIEALQRFHPLTTYRKQLALIPFACHPSSFCLLSSGAINSFRNINRFFFLYRTHSGLSQQEMHRCY